MNDIQINDDDDDNAHDDDDADDKDDYYDNAEDISKGVSFTGL